MDLLKQHEIDDTYKHIVWLDNLFTFACLLTVLKEEGFGAAGTVRTQQTRREVIEGESGTKAQKKNINKEDGRGLKPSLAELKTKYQKGLEWGKLYGALSDDKQVLEFAWKDQNVVLFMTTVHDGKEFVERDRRRPAKTATKAKTSRAVLGDDAMKRLKIPRFVDMYNHFMGGVDQADQL